MSDEELLDTVTRPAPRAVLLALAALLVAGSLTAGAVVAGRPVVEDGHGSIAVLPTVPAGTAATSPVPSSVRGYYLS